MIPKHRIPTHPGQILLLEFMEPLDLTQVAVGHRPEQDPGDPPRWGE